MNAHDRKTRIAAVGEFIGRLFAPLRRLTLRFWLTFALATALVEGGQLMFEHALASEERPSAYVDSLFALTGLYQRVLSAPRRPVVRHIAIVEIDPQKDLQGISASNICVERDFLAKLLTDIAEAHPALIVVDKSFGKTTCPADDPGTRALLTTAAEIKKSGVGLIVGLRTRSLPSTPQQHTTTGVSAVLDPTLDFGDGNALHAIINIAKDNRRLPLQWRVYETKTADTPVVKDTLALAAARSYEPYLLEKSPLLRTILDSGEQPFIGFLDTDHFSLHRYYAGHVVCGAQVQPDTAWADCSNDPVAGLRNKIVLVAERDLDRDQHHSTTIGNVPGFYLQANYIEALLDDRYFRQGGHVLDFASGFVFLVLLELILIVYHGRLAATIFLIGAMTAVTYAAIYLTIMHIGWYIDPVPLGATAVTIKVLHLFYGLVREERSVAEPEAV
jgi:CHASE2 domain-containing sensor protein